MLDKLKKYLNGEVDVESLAGAGPEEEDLRVACGALLLEMAGRDDDYAPEEVRAVFLEMKQQYGMEEDEILGLLKKSEEHREAEQKIDLFIEKINENYTDAQRQTVLKMAYSVVVADGDIEKSEEQFLKQLANRLKLDQEVAQLIMSGKSVA